MAKSRLKYIFNNRPTVSEVKVENTQEMRTLYEFTIPNETIHIKPPGESWQVWQLSEYNEKIEKVTGSPFTYRHGLFYNAAHERCMSALQQEIQLQALTSPPQLKSFLQQPRNYFAVQHLGDPLGFGLAANQYIEKGAVIGTYSGAVFFSHQEDPRSSSESEALNEYLAECAYDMSFHLSIPLQHPGDIPCKFTQRAHRIGDLTRFALHAPRANHVISNLTANTEFYTTIVEHNSEKLPLLCYQANRNILPGELVSLCYGDGYWKRRGIPMLLVPDKVDNKKFYHATWEPLGYRIHADRSIILSYPSPTPQTKTVVPPPQPRLEEKSPSQASQTANTGTEGIKLIEVRSKTNFFSGNGYLTPKRNNQSNKPSAPQPSWMRAMLPKVI